MHRLAGICLGGVAAAAARMAWEGLAMDLARFALGSALMILVYGATFTSKVSSASLITGSCGHSNEGGHSAAEGPDDREAMLPQAQAEKIRSCFEHAHSARTLSDTVRHGVLRMAISPSESHDERVPDRDSIWMADWTDVARAANRPLKAHVTEMFEIHDKATWLARLQRRREQAERTGKKKLVQKIQKEIAEAQKAVDSQRKVPRMLHRDVVVEPGATAGSPDDIWSMDWVSLTQQENQLPAVSVA